MNPELTFDIPIITLDLHVPEIEKVLSLYDRMEIWRSSDNITYNEITAPIDTYASIDGTAMGTWNLNGTTLSIAKNSASAVNITFTSPNPYDLLSLLNIINPYFYDSESPTYKVASQVPSNTNRLRLTSDLKGLESNIQISGTAASVLGFSATKVYGLIHRIVLTNPTTRYQFYDTSAENQTYYYKTRFSHSKTGRISAFSSYIISPSQPILDASNLVTCYCKLSDNQGYPIKDRRITLVLQQPHVVGSSSTLMAPLIGVMEQRIEVLTDQFGFASTKLPKNTIIKVFIENSYMNRIINTGTADFDLLDRVSTSYDPFNLVATPNLAPVIATLP